MVYRWTRRGFVYSTGCALIGCTGSTPAPSPPPPKSSTPQELTHETDDAFRSLEAAIGGQLGVFALDTDSGRSLGYRKDSRFALCSTFKWALAAAVLRRVDRGELRLNAPVPFGKADLLEWAPKSRTKVEVGSMSLEELCEAAITVSDNTAANLLLAHIGGPRGLTEFFRELGDSTTRLDRNEPTLNTNLLGDPRDTTSPRAMVHSMNTVFRGAALSANSQTRLQGWLLNSETGLGRLRAGLPTAWRVGNKTGTGARGAVNDLAFAWRPETEPLLVACYVSGSQQPVADVEAVHAEVARQIVAALPFRHANTPG